MDNFLLKVCQNIKDNDSFRASFERLYKFGLIHDLKGSVSIEELKRTLVDELYRIEISDEELKKLMESAFVFANINDGHSDDEAAADKISNLAYLIGISLLSYAKFYHINGIRTPVYRLLTRLGLLVGRDSFVKTEPESADMQSKLEFIAKEVSNSFFLPEQEEIEAYLTNFQMDVLRRLRDDTQTVVGISGPTSSGKNFVAKQYIMEKLLTESEYNVCIIVPSKALISEQNEMLSTEFGRQGLDVNVFTYGDITRYKSLQQKSKRNVFILTQERLHYFFEMLKEESQLYLEFKFNLLVVDECYKISYGNRGVLLNHVIRMLLRQRRIGKLVLLSPMLKQLKSFGKILGISEGLVHEKYSEFSPVSQNKILVEETASSRRKRFCYKSPLDDSSQSAFEFELGFTPSANHKAKLTELAIMLGKRSPLIVFRSEPGTSEKQAEDIARGYDDNRTYEELNSSLIGYIEETIGSDYGLIPLLKKGIAFHHGKVPISIRSRIESGFKNGSIHTLTATTTLSEGVNLPVKYLLMSKDVRDKSKLDFNNLCGRVGRYSSHLSGSLIFVEPEEYAELLTPQSDLNQVIQKPVSPITQILEVALDRQGHEKKDAFIEYLSSSSYRNTRTADEDGFEYLTGFLFDIYTSTPSEFADYVMANTTLGIEYIERLRSKLWVIENDMRNMGSAGIRSICKKNIFIDPRKLLDLYEAIRNHEHRLAPLVKVTGDNFYQTFKTFSLNVAKSFLPETAKISATDGSHYYLYFRFLYDWVTEKTVPQMRGRQTRGDNTKYSELFEIIEKEISFKFLNAMNAYMDVVNLCVVEIAEMEDVRHSIAEGVEYYDKKMISYVEYGSSSQLAFTLMNNGIHRESALVLRDAFLKEGIPLYGPIEEMINGINSAKCKVMSKLSNPILREELAKIRS